MEEKNVSDIDAQLRLAEILNDTPRQITLGERTFSIKALRPGTQYLIAGEAAKIAKASESFSDLIRQFAENIPSIIRCLTLAILNDKDKIYNEKEYKSLYEFIEWETNPNQWLSTLVEVMQMLDMNAFFLLTSQVDLFREITLTKKKKSEALLSKQQPK
jgi:hypothetical protein